MSKLDFHGGFCMNITSFDASKYKVKKESFDDCNKKEKFQQEVTERIREYHNKSFNIAQNMKNYIHNYDDLPRAKE